MDVGEVRGTITVQDQFSAAFASFQAGTAQILQSVNQTVSQLATLVSSHHAAGQAASEHADAERQAATDVNQSSEAYNKLNDSINELKSKFVELAAVVGAGLSLEKIIDDTVASQDAQAQLAAGLKATGAATGETREKLDALADSLSNSTKYSRTQIEQAESLGLTFTHINADAFPQFLKAAADIAARTGEDLPSAVQKLGRALDTGMVQSLKRAGITFDQTATAQAKFFAETGQYSKEIQLVLGAVEAKLSGSAEAARNTLGGALQLLRNQFEEVAISIGTQISPALTILTKQIGDFAKSDQFKALAADIGSALVTAVKVLGEAFSLLASHMELVKEAAAAIITIKLAAWLKEVSEAEILAGIAALNVSEAFEAIRVLGLAEGLQYVKLMIESGTAALRAFVAQAVVAAAPFAALATAVAGVAYAIRQYTLDQQAASEAMLKQLALHGQAHAAYADATSALSSIATWQTEVNRAQAAGDPSRLAAAEKGLAEAHKAVTQELKDRIQATGTALVAELALAQADLDHARQLAGQKVFFPAGPERDAAIAANKDVQDATGRVKDLQQEVQRLGDKYAALSKIPVVSDKQKGDIVSIPEHFNSAAQTVQAFADKIHDLTTKLLDNGANQSKLLSALSQGEVAYNLQKAAIERTNAIEQVTVQIQTAHRAELEKLTSEIDKAKAALSAKHGVDQAASAAISQGNAALALANRNYDTLLKSLSALAAKNVDWAQSEKQKLFILQDSRTAQTAYDTEYAKLQDLLNRNTSATQLHNTQLNVEKSLLAASKLGLSDLNGEIEKNVRDRDAQYNSLKAQVDIQTQLNALQDQTLNIKAQVADWYAERDAVAQYGANVASVLKQYGLLSAATQERTAQEAYLKELEKGASFEQALQLYNAIKGQQDIVNGLHQVQAEIVLAEQRYKEFADSLAQNFSGIFANFIKTGKISLADFESATVDAFASTAQKVISDWLSKWFEAMAEWLARWIATQAAANAAQSGLGSASGNSGTGGLSLGSLVSLGRAGYGAYTSGFFGGGNVATGVMSGPVDWNAAYVGGSSAASGGSALGSGAGAVAFWVAIIAAISIGIDKLNSHFQKTQESVITLNKTLDVSLTQKGDSQHVAGLVAAGQQLADEIKQFFTGYGAIFDSLDSSIAIKKRGRGGNTEWKVYVDGVVQSFGNDMNAALNYALIESLKHSSAVGLDPLAQAAIKDYAGNDAQQFKANIDFAERIATQNLPQLGGQVKAALTQYLQDLQQAQTVFAGDATALANATASINQKLNDTIAGLKNNVLGIDTSASDFLKGIVAFQEQMKNAGDVLRQRIQSQIDGAQQQLDALGSGPKTYAGMGQDERQQAQKEWEDQRAALKDEIKKYTDELGAIPQALSDQQVGMAVFNTLFSFIKDNAELARKYGADALKFAKMKVDIEFGEIKLQLIALNMWDQYAGLWTDAYNNAVKDAQSAISSTFKGSGGVSASNSPAAQLKAFFDTFNHSQLDTYHQALDDINKKYADAEKLAKHNAAALAQLAIDRQKEIDQLRATSRAQVESTINPLIAASQGISAAQQQLDAAIKQEAIDAAAYKEVGSAAWKVHLAYAQEYKQMGQAAIASLNLPLETLKAHFDTLSGTLKFLSDNLAKLSLSAADFSKVAGELGTQEFVSLADSLAQYSSDQKDILALNQMKWDLERAQLIAQVGMLEALDAQFHVLGAGMKDMLDRLVAGLPALAPANFGNTGSSASAGTGPNPANALADAAAQQQSAASALQFSATALAQAVQKLVDYGQSLLTNSSLSSLTPSQQRDVALQQLQTDYSSALGGNVDAVNAFQGLANTYLQLDRAINPSNATYGVDLQSVLSMINTIAQLAPNMPNIPPVGTVANYNGGGGVTGTGPVSSTGAGAVTLNLDPIISSISSASVLNHQDLGDIAARVTTLTQAVQAQQTALDRIASVAVHG